MNLRHAPPDPHDRPGWTADWQRRQDALGIDTHGDRLEPREIEFLERFLVDNQVRWIPRDRVNYRPTNDFDWVNNGNLTMELKSATTTYRSVRGHVHGAVRRATAQGVMKANFIIDLGDEALTDKLRRQLERYNTRSSTPILRLFVVSRAGLEEIHLLADSPRTQR